MTASHGVGAQVSINKQMREKETERKRKKKEEKKKVERDQSAKKEHREILKRK